MTWYEAKLDQLTHSWIMERKYDGCWDYIMVYRLDKCLWWIEKQRKKGTLENRDAVFTYDYLLELRHDKDKPLSEQENREEICDLIINLWK